MRPYLNTGKHTMWNDKLSELFVEHFEDEEEAVFMEKDKEMVAEMFLAHLLWLSHKWREHHPLTPEVQEKKGQRTKKLARRNTRRVDMSNSLCEYFAFAF